MYLFYGENNPLSNFHPRGFVVKGIYFNTCECFLMYCKARLFLDKVSAKVILAEPSPRLNKTQGRKVIGFNQSIWEQHNQTYLFIGCREKALQNLDIYNFLKSTGNKELAEASPWDRVYGIGLGLNDIRALDRSQWDGTNLLGKAWMRVRDEI